MRDDMISIMGPSVTDSAINIQNSTIKSSLSKFKTVNSPMLSVVQPEKSVDL